MHSYDITFSDSKIVDILSPYKVIHYGWADWNHRIEKSFRYGKQDSELKKVDLYKSNLYYVKEDLNEENIVLNDVNPAWLEEFRI